MIDQRSRANLGDEFFLAVAFRTEERCLFQSVQAAFMPGAVRQLMEDGAVEFCRFRELLPVRNDNRVSSGAIDRGFVEKERAIHLDCRVSCFSEVKDSILMWSYYANNHEGVCLEFDISRLDKENELNQSMIKNLSRVHYSPIRADVQYLAVGDTGLNFITSKADVWEHELEWRLICKTNEEYLPFDCISGIYLGVNFSQSSKEYKKLISVAAKYDWLPIYQGKLSLNRYEIEFEEDYSSNMQVYLKKNKQS